MNSNLISFTIENKFGILSESTKGWTTQLNLISWNGMQPKYDIRAWDADNEKMGRGISLTIDELHELKKLLETIETEPKE